LLHFPALDSVLLSNGSEGDFRRVFNMNVETLMQKNHERILILIVIVSSSS